MHWMLGGGAMTLADCGDTLSITELCAVLGIGKSAFFTLKQHGVLLIEPLPGLGAKVRYSKVAVQRYLDQPTKVRLKRSA